MPSLLCHRIAFERSRLDQHLVRRKRDGLLTKLERDWLPVLDGPCHRTGLLHVQPIKHSTQRRQPPAQPRAEQSQVRLDPVAQQPGRTVEHLQRLDIEFVEHVVLVPQQRRALLGAAHGHQHARQRLAHPQSRALARHAPQADHPAYHRPCQPEVES